MTRIILVRHCEAAGNLNRRFQGHTDAEVTENGKKQLELLALRMRNVKIDYLYSSPLKRAYATAEAINQFHHLPIYVEADLMEITREKRFASPPMAARSGISCVTRAESRLRN